MTSVASLNNVAGLYGLTPDGELGVYGAQREFIRTPEVTQTFAPQIRQLLKSYLANPHTGTYRLGLIYRAAQPHVWGSDTLVLEESVVREVYPVSGPAARELTAFQKKNRAKSIYRGIELFIDYRHEQLTDSPVYCPLLFDRNTTLGDYPSHLGFGINEEAHVPVVEVLNLMAVIPLGRRNTAQIAALMDDIRQCLSQKGKRRSDLFTLRSDAYHASPDVADADAGFFDVDKRHERQHTLNADAIGRRLAAAEQATRADRVQDVEQWLERPHRAVDAALLRTFVQFRDLDAARLALLAEKALVHTAPGGVQLLGIGMVDAWNMYLLEGTVSLRAADGGSLFVTGGTDKAASPIAFLKPRKYVVTAVTPVSFLWIHDSLLGAVLVPPDPAQQRPPVLKPFRS